MNKPLQEIFRPNDIREVFGQEHITGENKIIDRILKTGNPMNMIFYGPPGIGKTTVARIIAEKLNTKIHMFNATYTKTDEIKKVIKSYVEGNIEKIKPVIYVDEIQNFNKKQQQIFLEFIENGTITFIASTTENPNHYVYKALLSRLVILEFYKVSKEKIEENLSYIIEKLNKTYNKKFSITEEALDTISTYADMDVRRSIYLLEIVINLYFEDEEKVEITKEQLKSLGISRHFSYDMMSDEYYDIISAFQKSIRGSDENAALFYLARCIKSGDIKPICRRLMVIAAEDIGLAFPNAITIVKNCIDSALELGLPEARILLAEAVILLATSPKSNSVITAIDSAISAIDEKGVGKIPMHLRDSHYALAKKLKRGEGYKYPHDYKNNYVKQEYLPAEHRDDIYYVPQNNKYENEIRRYSEKIKKEN